jgi:hypothetical protein
VKSSDVSAKSLVGLAYSVSREGRKCVLIMKETLWKNNAKFVKDGPEIFVTFTVIVITVSKEKSRHYFPTTLLS